MLTPAVTALIYMTLAAFTGPVVGLCVKLVAEEGMSDSGIVFWRSIMGLIVILALMPVWGSQYIKTPRIKRHIIRGFASFVAIALFFYTLPRMPMANAMVLQQTVALFLPLWGLVMFREKLKSFDIALLLISFGGVYLVATPEDWSITPLIVILGLASSAIGAGTSAYGKSLVQSEHPYTLMFYFALTTSVFAALWHVIDIARTGDAKWPPLPSLSSLALMALAGFVGNMAQIWVMIAYKDIKSSFMAILCYLPVPISLVVGIFLFNESPGWLEICGMGIILLAVALHSFIEERNHRAIKKDS